MINGGKLTIFLANAATTESSDNLIVENTTKKVSAFANYWQNIDWDRVLAFWIDKGLAFIGLCIVFFILKKVGNFLIRRTFHNYSKKEIYSESRVKTLETLTNNIFSYTLLFFFLYSFLTIIGIPVGSLLAGAGIAGLAIGLGAQGFINDIITGFVMILERQLDVGDMVRLGGVEGKVMAVGLRTTQVKGVDGTLHFIPNRNITIVSNLSRANMRVMIDVRISPDGDIKQITEIIENVNKNLLASYPEIKSGPDVFGVVDLGNGNLAIRVVMYTLNGTQANIQQEFLAAYVAALQAADITIPTSPINLA